MPISKKRLKKKAKKLKPEDQHAQLTARRFGTDLDEESFMRQVFEIAKPKRDK